MLPSTLASTWPELFVKLTTLPASVPEKVINLSPQYNSPKVIAPEDGDSHSGITYHIVWLSVEILASVTIPLKNALPYTAGSLFEVSGIKVIGVPTPLLPSDAFWSGANAPITKLLRDIVVSILRARPGA